MRAAILIVGSLILLTMAYYSGKRANWRTAYKAEDRERAVIADLAVARTDRDEARQQIGHLEARRQLHLALLALDERNFGIAQRHLGEAGRLLSPADETRFSSNGGELARLGQQIAAANLVAAADMGQQRAQLLDFVRRFDVLVPPPLPAPNAATPAPEAAAPTEPMGGGGGAGPQGTP